MDRIFETVYEMLKNMDDNFVALGGLLADIKKNKLYAQKGYGSFKDFVENEYNMSSPRAAKLIGFYSLFIKTLGEDEETLKSIGVDKTTLMYPVVKKMAEEEPSEAKEWVRKVSDNTISSLKEEVKRFKEPPVKDIKAVYTDQVLGNLQEALQCKRKQLLFSLALYISGESLDAVMETVRNKTADFNAKIYGTDVR